MLDFRLRVFRAVAEKLNFTRAAEQLHLSQPAVTQHIKLLEEHYGTALFQRAARGISLTSAGQTLLQAVDEVLELERQTETRLRAGQAFLSGPLRLAASTTVAQYFLPAVLSEFQENHPRVRLTLRVGNTREVADGVRAGRIDLGLIEGPVERRNVKAEPFFTDEILCVASPRHRFALGSAIKPADLLESTFVLREIGSGTRQIVEKALRQARVTVTKLQVQLEAESSETIKRLVAAGNSLAFLSRLAIESELKTGELKVVQIAGVKMTREFSFVYAQGPRVEGAAGAFLETVARYARKAQKGSTEVVSGTGKRPA